jgi:hypothetical protein
MASSAIDYVGRALDLGLDNGQNCRLAREHPGRLRCLLRLIEQLEDALRRRGVRLRRVKEVRGVVLERPQAAVKRDQRSVGVCVAYGVLPVFRDREWTESRQAFPGPTRAVSWPSI